MLWQILSLPKLYTVYYCNTCDNRLMLYAILSFNSSFIHDISRLAYLYYQYHTMFTCTPFPHFYTHWEFWLSEFAHLGIWLLHFIDHVFDEKLMYCEELGLIHLIFWSWVLFLLCSLFLVSFIRSSKSSGLCFILFDYS